LEANQVQAGKQKTDPLFVRPSTYLQAVEEAESKAARLLSEIKHLMQTDGDVLAISSEMKAILEGVLQLSSTGERFPLPRSRKYKTAMKYLTTKTLSRSKAILYSWAFTASLGKLISPDADHPQTDSAEISRSWVDEWLLGKIITGTLQELGVDEEAARNAITLVKILIKHRSPGAHPIIFDAKKLLSDVAVQSFVGVNRYQDVLWYNKESFEELVWWLYATSVIIISASQGIEKEAGETAKAILEQYDAAQHLLTAEAESGYQVEKLLEAAR
jgi:hypothetical protein